MENSSNSTTLSPLDTLIAISHYLPKKRKKFILNNATFYTFFYERKKRYPEVLGGLKFEWDAPYPKSPELTSAMHVLRWTGFLVTPRVYSNEYRFDQNMCESSFNLRKEKISPAQLSQIEEIAKEFDKELVSNSIF